MTSRLRERMSARVESGLLTKSSSATYDLRVRIADPTKLRRVRLRVSATFEVEPAA